MREKNHNAIKGPKYDYIFKICNYTLLMLLNIIMLYPILYTIAQSLSNPVAIQRGQVWLYPVDPTVEGYQKILGDKQFLRSYLNTILYSSVATVISLTLLSVTAYPLSIPNLKWKKQITFYFTLTMFIGGGMVPTYLIYKSYGIINTIWAVVLPGAMSVWYLMLCRTFFQGLPTSLRESAQLDGANDWIILIRITIPLSKALLAVMALYVIVGQWNNYFTPFLYLSDDKKYPLQVTLRRILDAGKTNNDAGYVVDPDMMERVTPTTLRAAAICVTILPIMCVYPFIQKYFVKGVMIGSLKG